MRSRGAFGARVTAGAIVLLGAVVLTALASAAPVRSTLTLPSLPVFTWSAIRGADHYEFQLAADAQFNSPALGMAGHFTTKNTRATIAKIPPDGSYWWRVRAVSASGSVSSWSVHGPVTKKWSQRPTSLSPLPKGELYYPGPPADKKNAPRLFSWHPVAGAVYYSVAIATDPKMATLVGRPVETSATSLVPPVTLASGTYYWRVTPFDAEHNQGESAPPKGEDGQEFKWVWNAQSGPHAPALPQTQPMTQPQTPSGPGLNVVDLALDSAPAFKDFVGDTVDAARAFDDPQLQWTPIAGAARYELEINFSHDWATGSRVCCSKSMVANTYSPLQLLDNNTYYWRVRPYDLGGHQGDWREGPSFVKTFDNLLPQRPNGIALPSIKRLHVRDNLGDSGSSGPGFATSSPIVVWQPVVGASAYDISVAPFSGYCQWASRWDTTTSNTSWTPLGPAGHARPPYPNGNVPIAADLKTINTGNHYCVRVRAVGDSASKGRVYGDYTELDDAFAFTGYAQGSGSLGAVAAYREPTTSCAGNCLATPLFTWQVVPGASSYWVIVARDQSFTTIVDYAFTRIPAYAPRKTYADEMTAYYWKVLPSWAPLRSLIGSDPAADLAATPSASFNKRSEPPQPFTPVDGKPIGEIFRWRPALGARNYHLQVSTDPKFQSGIIDDVTTASTAYTSESTYPSGTPLFWRVQAVDENKIGLTWSHLPGKEAVPYSFERQLPAPQKAANASIGEQIPIWRWQPLPNAVSYDLHITLPNGSVRDFSQLPTSSWVAGSVYGIGKFKWKVRAEFPKKNAGTTPGPYFKNAVTFTKTLGPPSGAHTLTSGGLVFAWSPKVGMGVRAYQVRVSRSPDFGHPVDSATVETPAYAPTLMQGDYAKGGTFYWCVAAADAGYNVGNCSPPKKLLLPKRTTLPRPATGAIVRKTLTPRH